jgi:hypothetical protein
MQRAHLVASRRVDYSTRGVSMTIDIALIEHAAHLGGLMDAFVATGSLTGEVLGQPSAQVRANLAEAPVGLFTLSSRCSHRSQVASKFPG